MNGQGIYGGPSGTFVGINVETYGVEILATKCINVIITNNV